MQVPEKELLVKGTGMQLTACESCSGPAIVVQDVHDEL
jgi:hypothetical protein